MSGRRWHETSEALTSPIPWIALTAAIALSIAGWVGLERSRMDQARAQFERRTETAEAAVRARLRAYEQVLRSGAARIASSPGIPRDEWRDFVANLQVGTRFPGLLAMGYVERVAPEDRDAHVKRMRATGIPDYDVHPDGDRDELEPVVMSEPLASHGVRALGFDMATDSARRAAMDKARASGEPAVTGRIDFTADGADAGNGAPEERGFLMFVPVYRMPARQGSGKAEVAGYVFGPMRAQDVLRDALDAGVRRVVDMRIFDEPSSLPSTELIDTSAAHRAATAAAAPTFSRRILFQMPGRLWSIQFISRPEFDAAVETSRPWLVLTASLVGAFVLFVLTTLLVAAWNRAHELSMRDPLTGLYNRRYLEETMGRELPRARRLGASVGVIVIDIDHFKQLNDTHGHDAGDFVLERTGALLRAETRKSDIACRFGGEEFALVLPGATLQVARVRAEAIRSALEAMALDFGGRPLGPLTLSAGVSSMPPHAQDWSQALRRADRALYAAKESGRNKVMAALME